MGKNHPNVDPYVVSRVRALESLLLEKGILAPDAVDRVVERYDDGLLTVSYIERADYEETGADESYSEGIVDHIRSLDGTVVAALVREQLKEGREGIRKVSLRATSELVDVSVIARKEGGGGHRQAAGFSTTKVGPELIDFLRSEISAQL